MDFAMFRLIRVKAIGFGSLVGLSDSKVQTDQTDQYIQRVFAIPNALAVVRVVDSLLVSVWLLVASS